LRAFTGSVRGRSDGTGSGEAVTWYKPEGRREALSLDRVVGHELNVESIARGRDCLIVGVLAEMLHARRHGVSTVMHRDEVAAAEQSRHSVRYIPQRNALLTFYLRSPRSIKQ